jgi:hypothetical protein
MVRVKRRGARGITATLAGSLVPAAARTRTSTGDAVIPNGIWMSICPGRHEIQRRTNRALARLRHFNRYSFQLQRQRRRLRGHRARRRIPPEDGNHHSRRDLGRIVGAVQYASRVDRGLRRPELRTKKR